MKPRKLRGVLGLSLIATFTAAWFAPPSGEGGVVLSERAQTVAGRNPAVPQTAAISRAKGSNAVEVLRIRPRDKTDAEDAEDSDEASIFSPTQWTPPVNSAPVPIATATAAAPAAPQAPPLPFHFLGRYEEAGQVVVFLQYNDQNLVVRVGDTIAEQYRVESLKGTTLNLRYLPLNQPQTLEVGGTQ